MTLREDPELLALAEENGIEVRGFYVGSADAYVSGFASAADEADVGTTMAMFEQMVALEDDPVA